MPPTLVTTLLKRKLKYFDFKNNVSFIILIDFNLLICSDTIELLCV